MTREELQRARSSPEAFDKAYQLALNLIENLSSTCLNCGHFQGDDLNYICKQFNLKPPPIIIINGCEQHTALIPF